MFIAMPCLAAQTALSIAHPDQVLVLVLFVMTNTINQEVIV